MFLVLALGGCQQVFRRGADFSSREAGGYLQITTIKEPEEPLGMLLLLAGGLLEDVGDLHEPLLPCRSGEIGVAVARLALAGERLQQILLRLRPLD